MVHNTWEEFVLREWYYMLRESECCRPQEDPVGKCIANIPEDQCLVPVLPSDLHVCAMACICTCMAHTQTHVQRSTHKCILYAHEHPHRHAQTQNVIKHFSMLTSNF